MKTVFQALFLKEKKGPLRQTGIVNQPLRLGRKPSHRQDGV